MPKGLYQVPAAASSKPARSATRIEDRLVISTLYQKYRPGFRFIRSICFSAQVARPLPRWDESVHVCPIWMSSSCA